MPQSKAKTEWIKKNAIIMPIKLMRRTEADLIEYLDLMLSKGVPKGTVIKTALREYMERHPISAWKENNNEKDRD